MKAILVIDLQHGFLNSHTLHLPEKIRDLLAADYFRYRLFSKFENRELSPFDRFMDWQEMRGGHSVEICSELEQEATAVFRKPGYSCVTPELVSHLVAQKIQEVHLVGIDTDCCVLTTAVDLFQLGIRPIVLGQYCASSGGEQFHQAALTILPRLIGIKQVVS